MAQHEYITLITMLRNVALFLLWKKFELKQIKKDSEFYVWNVPMHTQGFLRHTFYIQLFASVPELIMTVTQLTQYVWVFKEFNLAFDIS